MHGQRHTHAGHIPAQHRRGQGQTFIAQKSLTKGELQLRHSNQDGKSGRISNDAIPIFGPCKTQGQHEKVCEPQWIRSRGGQRSSVVLPTLHQNRAGLVTTWATKLIQHACKTWMICLHYPCFANGQLLPRLAALQTLSDNAPIHRRLHRPPPHQTWHAMRPGAAPRQSCESRLLSAARTGEFVLLEAPVPERRHQRPSVCD